jgi:general stress protein YciG
MALGTTLAIIGLATSIYGQVKAGQAAKKVGQSQGEREDFNAQQAEIQAADARAIGHEEESRFRTQVRGLLGSQRAGFAGQNVVVGSGSAADVQADAARLGEFDAIQIRNNAARQARGFEAEATDRRMAADIARRGGAAAASAANWGAATTGVLGASSLLMNRYGYARSPSRAA